MARWEQSRKGVGQVPFLRSEGANGEDVPLASSPVLPLTDTAGDEWPS